MTQMMDELHVQTGYFNETLCFINDCIKTVSMEVAFEAENSAELFTKDRLPQINFSRGSACPHEI